MGDTVHLLNLGGVLGICNSVNPDLGRPFECEVLGTVLAFPFLGERIGRPAKIGESHARPQRAARRRRGAGGGDRRHLHERRQNRRRLRPGARAGAPRLHRRRLQGDRRLAAPRHPGDGGFGARRTAIFTDLGVVSSTRKNAAPVTRTLLTRLAAEKPDLIMVELGDGLLGAYGVDAILEDEAIRGALTAVVMAANDPVAAWGGIRILREVYGIEPVAVTGPATDNAVGTTIIEETMKVPAKNARTHPEALTEVVLEKLALPPRAGAGN